jgi:tetratricopeptide (TPR) repeat protein
MKWIGLVSVIGLLACGGSAKSVRQPGDPLAGVPGDALYRQGVMLVARQDFVRAEQYFAAAMARGVREARVMPMLMRACLESSRLHAALGHALPYLSRTPGDWRLRYLVASVLAALGDPAQARQHLDRVIAVAPDFADAHFLLGTLARDELDLERAQKDFARYLALAPEGKHADEARDGLAHRRLRSVPGKRSRRRVQ